MHVCVHSNSKHEVNNWLYALSGADMRLAEAILRQRHLLIIYQGAGGYTDEYARKLLEWHKKPDGKTIPIPTDQDDIHTFVMDGLRDEMTVEDVALHRIRQQEVFLLKRGLTHRPCDHPA